MSDLKKKIALIIVGQWVASISIILILVIFNLLKPSEGIEFLKSYSSITSGFVGIIIGYLFSSDN